MDLYNDSANFALSSFKKQYLYDEIEAEVGCAAGTKRTIGVSVLLSSH